MKWNSVKDKYPQNLQKVKIKVNDINEILHEMEAVFRDFPEYRSWEITPKEGITIYARPTHWMEI